ncbi:hypothetical protein ACSBR1_011390 [Camellia fascicularis]
MGSSSSSNHLLHFYYTSSRGASRFNPLSAYFLFTPLRRYSRPSKQSNGHGKEKAPTMAEEFERVAEEFERVAEAKAHQGVASQTSKRMQDATEEAALGDARNKSLKERYKEPVGKGNFKKTKTDDE